MKNYILGDDVKVENKRKVMTVYASLDDDNTYESSPWFRGRVNLSTRLVKQHHR